MASPGTFISRNAALAARGGDGVRARMRVVLVQSARVGAGNLEGDAVTRKEKYEQSEKGMRTRERWRKRNKRRLRANVRRHRLKMKAIKEAGRLLRARFPNFTAAGERGATRHGSLPAAGTGSASIGSLERAGRLFLRDALKGKP
jgi:hypothetical protein